MKKFALALALVAPLFAGHAQAQDVPQFIGNPERAVDGVPALTSAPVPTAREFANRGSRGIRSQGETLTTRDKQDLEYIRNH